MTTESKLFVIHFARVCVYAWHLISKHVVICLFFCYLFSYFCSELVRMCILKLNAWVVPHGFAYKNPLHSLLQKTKLLLARFVTTVSDDLDQEQFIVSNLSCTYVP